MVELDLAEDTEARQTLTHQLMSRVDRPDLHKPYGLYFVSMDGDWGGLGKFVEREVFLNRFGNDELQMIEEYGPYDAASFFVLVIDHGAREPIGEFRVIEHSPAGLKTLTDIGSEPEWGVTIQEFVERHCPDGDLTRVVDAATLAVRQEWSASKAGSLASLALYGGLFRACVALQAEVLVTTLDENVADMLRMVGVPIEPLCDLPAIEYLGSSCTRPYVVQWQTINAATRSSPELMGAMMGGVVDGEFSLPPIDLDNPNPHPTDLEPQYIDETSTPVPSLDEPISR